MAAVVCTMTQMPTESAAMAQGCQSVASSHTHQSNGICQKHCTPDPTSASTQNLLGVPALALPPVMFGLTVIHGRDQAASVADIAFARWDPPPRLRYCRLLI